MKGIKLATVVAVTAAAALVGGCGRAEPGAGEPATTSPSVTQSAPTSQMPRMPRMPGTTHPRPHHTSAPHTPAPHRAPVLANGRHCVWLTGLHRGARTLTFDVIQWLTGEEVDEAFHREHPEAPDAHAPNGFYVVNQNPRLRTLPVEHDATVSLLVPAHGAVHQTIPFAALPRYLSHDLDPNDRKLWYNPFWLTVRNDRIVAVVEQYTP